MMGNIGLYGVKKRLASDKSIVSKLLFVPLNHLTPIYRMTLWSGSILDLFVGAIVVKVSNIFPIFLYVLYFCDVFFSILAVF